MSDDFNAWDWCGVLVMGFILYVGYVALRDEATIQSAIGLHNGVLMVQEAGRE